MRQEHRCDRTAARSVRQEPSRESREEVSLEGHGERFTGADAARVRSILARDADVCSLRIERLHVEPEQLASLSSALSRITHLSLIHTGLHSEHIIELGTGICQSATLVDIDVSCNELRDSDADVLFRAVARSSSVTRVRLGSNPIGCAGVEHLVRCLRQRGRLEGVDLRSCELAQNGALELAEALLDGCSVERLELSDNRIDDDGALGFGRVLALQNDLRTLGLAMNSISSAGCAALARGLAQNGSLEDLDLSDNHVCDRGARKLARALEKNKTLRVLSLDDNTVSYSGSCALARALRSGSALERLSLSGNALDDKGMIAFGRALAENRLLRELDLDFNCIEDAGAAHVLRALRKSPGTSGIAVLSMRGNDLGDATASNVARTLQYNSRLEYVDLRVNHMITNAQACHDRDPAKTRARRTAFAMSQHRRLGAQSPAHVLPPEIAEYIGRMITPAVVLVDGEESAHDRAAATVKERRLLRRCLCATVSCVRRLLYFVSARKHRRRH